MVQFSIRNTTYTVDGSGTPDRITSIDWKATKTEGQFTVTSYGQTGCDLPADSITEQDAITYLEAETTTIVEAELDEKLDALNNPPTIKGRVWDIPVGATIWRSDTAYALDDVALYDSVPWTCIQAHTSQRGWTPPSVPALWEIQNQGGGIPQWVAGEAVEVGEQRIYEGVTYQVIQAHTTLVGWEPPNVPALWSVV